MRQPIASIAPCSLPEIAPLPGLDDALRAFAAHPEGLDEEGHAALTELTAAWYERQCALSRPLAGQERVIRTKWGHA